MGWKVIISAAIYSSTLCAIGIAYDLPNLMMSLLWATWAFGVVLILDFGDFRKKSNTPKGSNARKDSKKVGTITLNQYNAKTNAKGQDVTVLVEEVGQMGRFSQIKVKSISGTREFYHQEIKEMLGNFVPTQNVEWL